VSWTMPDPPIFFSPVSLLTVRAGSLLKPHILVTPCFPFPPPLFVRSVRTLVGFFPPLVSAPPVAPFSHKTRGFRTFFHDWSTYIGLGILHLILRF